MKIMKTEGYIILQAVGKRFNGLKGDGISSHVAYFSPKKSMRPTILLLLSGILKEALN